MTIDSMIRFKNKLMKNKSVVFFLIILFFFKAQAGYAHDSDSSIYQANRFLARTINIGYTIEFQNPVVFEDSLSRQLESLKERGFTAVRLPINWISAMDSLQPWKIQSSFLKGIDQVITKAFDLQLAVILDNHTDEQLMNNPAMFGARIFSLWEQLSDHYKHFPNSLMFELLAEPHGNLDPYWNTLLSELLKVIRVKNSERPVIVGPINFNRPEFLNQLQLPIDDKFIIVSFHQYNPIRFTMQGETWFPFGKPLEWIGTPWPKNGDEEFLTRMFDQINEWAIKNQRPVFLDEFGVSSMADTASAFRWIQYNRTLAEKNKMSWGYWSCFGKEFSLFNQEKQSWNTRFLEALIPTESE